MNLVKDIYLLTRSFPSHEKFGLSSQMQRAAVSIPSNIAEGSAKSSNKDFARFLEMSIGSSYELETGLIIASNLEYINIDAFQKVLNQIAEVQKMINGFKSKLN